MFDKKKINFWRLAFAFTGLVIFVLMILWGGQKELKAQMMDGSMGSMMTQMHAQDQRLYDLVQLNPEQQENFLGDNSSHQSHHQKSPEIASLNIATTLIIFLLLPFIIGGSVFLAIVWFNKGGDVH